MSEAGAKVRDEKITIGEIREALLSLSGDQVMSILIEMNKPTIVADILDHCNLDVKQTMDLIKFVGLDTELSQKLLLIRKGVRP